MRPDSHPSTHTPTCNNPSLTRDSTCVAFCANWQLAFASGEAAAKKVAVRTMVVSQTLVIAMQFYKPAGTGVEGSPEMGPLPLMIGLMVPSLYGAYVA